MFQRKGAISRESKVRRFKKSLQYQQKHSSAIMYFAPNTSKVMRKVFPSDDCAYRSEGATKVSF